MDVIATRGVVSHCLIRSVILLVVLAAAVTGCRSDGQDETEAIVAVDLEAIRERFQGELEQAEQLLKPAKFKLRHNVSEVPTSCELPNGDEGRSYLFYVRESPGPIDNPESKANMLAEHWRGRGFEVEVVDDLGIRVVARNGEGGFLRFVVDEPGMTLSGETPCVPA